MSKPDLTYQESGLFVSFYPETDAGKVAWQALVDPVDGSRRFFAIHLPGILQQLRQAGYTVHKAKPVTESDDTLLQALGIL